MNFLVDRCAGRRLTQWLQSQGHDALDARDLGPDPGDRIHPLHVSGKPCTSGFRRTNRVKFRPAMKAAPG